MKPAPFAYAACGGSEEAVAALVEHGDEAKVLAGGQSLVPIMNMRMARPTTLVDVSGAADMTGLRVEGARAVIGGAVTQLNVERSAEIAARLPILPEALAHVGHVPIRARGTVGGSVAHADPAAEMPAVMVALGAELVVRAPAGPRTVSAAEFFVTHFTTVLEPEEVLVEIQVPVPGPGSGTAFLEVARRHGDFALVGVAAVVEVEDGSVRAARAVLSGVADVPLAVTAAAATIVGSAVAEVAAAPGLEEAVAAALDPPADIHASSDYRRKVAGVLVRRALGLAARRALDPEVSR